MSRMMLRSNGKPPLARSPIRLRSRGKALQPTNSNTTHTPPGSLSKSQLSNPNRATGKPDLRPEYHTISYELRALAKKVHQEFGPKDDDTTMADAGARIGSRRSPLFERGRFYDEYAARRNERLKRKKGGGEVEPEKKPSYGLGVRVESAKKRESSGKFDSRRKVAAAAMTPVAERREAPTPRYSLRSCANNNKENKKPPLPLPVPIMSVERSVGVSERKVGVRRNRKA